MILCTSDEVNSEGVKRLMDETKEEVVQGEILSIPEEIRNQVKILLTYGNYHDSITEQDLGSLPNLKWIQVMSSGTEQLPLEFIASRNLVLTSARGVHALPISEYVFAMILFFAKKIEKYQYLKQRMVWNYSEEMIELYGKTIGILGTGSIGRAIAEKAHAFGMVPIGVNRNGRDLEGFEKVYSFEQLEACLPQCDYLCAALPSTSQTGNLINAERIALMKEGVIFINVGRGDLIVEKDFIQAMQSGKIAGAALDVFRDEPLEYDHSLWHLENLVITPHASAKTNMYTQRVLDIFIKNYFHFKNELFDKMINRVEYL